MFDMPIIESALGVLLGGLLTWGCSWWYYKRAGDELQHEARALHTALSAMANALTQQKDARLEFVRNADDRLTGLKVSAEAHITGVAAVGALGNVTGKID
jgi:hypothetical protein